jgi:hypothetical protein
VLWSAILTSEMSIIEVNAVVIAPCLVSAPAFFKSSKIGWSTVRSRISNSSMRLGSKEPSKSNESLPRRRYNWESYTKVREREPPELEFTTAAEGYGGPTKTPVAHGVGTHDHVVATKQESLAYFKV